MRRNVLKVGLALLLLAIVSAAVLPFIVKPPPVRGTVPPLELAGEESSFVVIDGIRFRYTIEGEGDGVPIVFLHGFGANASSFETVAGLLARERTVVAFDRPAFGLTERPMPPLGAEDPYSLRQAAEQTVALLDYLGIARAVLVAHSAGAEVAITVALEHPERVSGLVLEAPALYGRHRAARWVGAAMRTPWGRLYGPLVLRRTFPSAGDRLLDRAHAHPEVTLTEELREGYRLPLRAEHWDRALWEYSASASPSVVPRLGGVSLPVSVVYGSEDRIVPPEDSRRVAEAIPGAEGIEIPDTGHVPHEERPERFGAAVESLARRARSSD